MPGSGIPQDVPCSAMPRRGSSTEAWRTVVYDLIRRGLRRPEFLIVDGALGLDKAIAAVWDGGDCCVEGRRTVTVTRRAEAARGLVTLFRPAQLFATLASPRKSGLRQPNSTAVG